MLPVLCSRCPCGRDNFLCIARRIRGQFAQRSGIGSGYLLPRCTKLRSSTNLLRPGHTRYAEFICPKLYMGMAQKERRAPGSRGVRSLSLPSIFSLFSPAQVRFSFFILFFLLFSLLLYILVRRNLSGTQIEKRKKELHRVVKFFTLASQACSI